jgi:hypothetical protein
LEYKLVAFDRVNPVVGNGWINVETSQNLGVLSQFLTGSKYSQYGTSTILGGVGNWDHGSLGVKLKNLPGSLLIYAQFTFYAFYNFDQTNSEGI